MLCTISNQFSFLINSSHHEPEMLINLSFETFGHSVPMQLKFKRSVNSL